MTDSKDTNIKASIDVVTGLVQAIPIYQDAIQPAAKQIGKSVETIAKTVNIALSPMKAFVWGYEKIEKYIIEAMEKRFEKIPIEKIVTPSPQIAVPIIDALRYTGHDDELRELFANLLATSMNSDTITEAHPAYINIIKNITSDEAIFLKAFVKQKCHPALNLQFTDPETGGYIRECSCYTLIGTDMKIKHEDMEMVYINNLCRLGLLEQNEFEILVPGFYDALFALNEIKQFSEMLKKHDRRMIASKKHIQTTDFGAMFIKNIVSYTCDL